MNKIYLIILSLSISLFGCGESDTDTDTTFSIDMSQKTASSILTFSSCPADPLGWNYTFTGTSMTLTGSDGWQTVCDTNPEETITVANMTTLESDFDVPFNCAEYPICKLTDFNKTLSGIDEDGRSFTSTYTFDRQTSVLTYIKSVEGTTFTEVVTIHDETFSVDMSQKTASSVLTFSSCPADPLGWNYTFTGTSMTLIGSDGWQTPACTTNPEETITVANMTTLANDFDIPFNCAEYPICKIVDFNKILIGIDEDGRDFISFYTFNQQTNVLTYIKYVEGATFTEVVTIQ